MSLKVQLASRPTAGRSSSGVFLHFVPQKRGGGERRDKGRAADVARIGTASVYRRAKRKACTASSRRRRRARCSAPGKRGKGVRVTMEPVSSLAAAEKEEGRGKENPVRNVIIPVMCGCTSKILVVISLKGEGGGKV